MSRGARQRSRAEPRLVKSTYRSESRAQIPVCGALYGVRGEGAPLGRALHLAARKQRRATEQEQRADRKGHRGVHAGVQEAADEGARNLSEGLQALAAALDAALGFGAGGQGQKSAQAGGEDAFANG